MRYIALRVCAALFSLCATILVGILAFVMFAMGSIVSGITVNGAGLAPLLNKTLWDAALWGVFGLFCFWHFIVMACWPRKKLTARTLVGLAKAQVLQMMIAIGSAVFAENLDNLRLVALLFFVLLIQSVFLMALKATLLRAEEWEEPEDIVDEEEIRFRPGRALWSFTKYFFLWPAGALCLLMIGMVATNAFDQKLSQQAQDMMKVPPNPYRSSDNLYVALLGVDAPPGQEPIAYAEAKIQAFNEQAAVSGIGTDLKTWRSGTPEPMPFVGNIDFCNPFKVSLWLAARSHRAEIAQLMRANEVSYRRYAALHSLRGFHDPTVETVYTPGSLLHFSPPIRNLYLASLALQIQSGNLAQQKEALAALRSDIAMQRQIMVESDRLIWKAVASSNLEADFLLLADIAADYSFESGSLSAEMESMLAPFRVEDWQIGGACSSGFRDILPALTGVNDIVNGRPKANADTPIAAYFYKINATINLAARLRAELAEAVDVAPQDLLASRDNYLLRLRESTGIGLGYFYNPTGKMLAAMDAESAKAEINYALRNFDSAAIQRLARLSYEIRKQHIPTEHIAEFMARHPEWATHPVDGREFNWNPSAHKLTINPVAERRAGRRYGVE